MRKLFWKLRDAYHSVRYAIQRVYQGYDDRDMLEFYPNFLKRTTKILKSYKKNNISYPGNITEEKWDEILQEIIDCFENADEFIAADNLFGGFEKFINDWSFERQAQLDEYVEKNKNRGFDLLKEHFFHLWY